MDIHLAKRFANKVYAKQAEDIVRKCVHCGFCNATCPTYQLLGDESDGPRGRIYLIKQLLENGRATKNTRVHLDRCLLCRACETTCPSGVEYGHLLEIGRTALDDIRPRSKLNEYRRKLLAKSLVQRPLINTLVKASVYTRKWLPKTIQKQLPESVAKKDWPEARHSRKMLVLTGCVQPALSPVTNLKAAQVLDQLGISLIQETNQGCCGAVGLHTSDTEMGMQHIRQRIDYWWPYIESGIEAILFTASGCGVTIKDYAYLLKDEPQYAQKASRVSVLAKDLSEIVFAEIELLDAEKGQRRKIVFHPPCTLQHGLKLDGVVEKILSACGYDLLSISDAHLCCGSAGTYSIFQPDISRRLRDNKLTCLQQDKPELIATANIGCQQHLNARAEVKVVHWIELL
jgi:glycolate oxidase iron-sulfur subunit